MALQTHCNSEMWQLSIKFECTVRDTPQQNSLAEVGIFCWVSRVQAMIHFAHGPLECWYKLFHNCYAMETMNDGLIIVNVNGKYATHFECFFGKNPKLATNLWTWRGSQNGEALSEHDPKIVQQGENVYDDWICT